MADNQDLVNQSKRKSSIIQGWEFNNSQLFHERTLDMRW